MDDPYVTGVCRRWHLRTHSMAGTASVRRVLLASDTRTMPAVLAILIRPDTG